MSHPTAVISAASVPARNDEAITCEVDNELVVYTPESHQGISLNASARSIWECCDGARSVEQIAREISKKLGVPEDEAVPELTEDVIHAVENLQKNGLVKIA